MFMLEIAQMHLLANMKPGAWTVPWPFQAVALLQHEGPVQARAFSDLAFEAAGKLLPSRWNLTYLWFNTYRLICSSSRQTLLLYKAQNGIGYGPSVDSKLNRCG